MKKLLALTLLSLSFAAFAAGGKQMTFDVEVEKNGKTLAAASLVTEDGAETPLSMRNVKTYLAKVVNGKEEMGTVETGLLFKVKPEYLSDNRIYVGFQIDFSELVGLNTIESAGSKIELPEVERVMFQNKWLLGKDLPKFETTTEGGYTIRLTLKHVR